MSTKWRKYRKTYVNKYVFVHENYIKAHVCLYFLHLVLTFTPHYIIMVKGLFSNFILCSWPKLGALTLAFAVTSLCCCVTEQTQTRSRLNFQLHLPIWKNNNYLRTCILRHSYICVSIRETTAAGSWHCLHASILTWIVTSHNQPFGLGVLQCFIDPSPLLVGLSLGGWTLWREVLIVQIGESRQ